MIWLKAMGIKRNEIVLKKVRNYFRIPFKALLQKLNFYKNLYKKKSTILIVYILF